MTLKRLMTTVVVATPIGSPPPYAKLGQGVMGGTIAAMAEGDAVEARFQLDELQHVFQREFDRGDLTVGALQLDLWQAHWYRASRQAMQRAADMLILAAGTDIPGSSKLARECEGLAKVLDLFVNAQPKDHPIGDALLRGEPVPSLDLSRGLGLIGQDGHQEQIIPMVRTPDGLSRSEASALRADGIRPFSDAKTLADRVSHQLFIRGMAEADLARISGVPQPTVHRIASGASKSPRYESVQAIAKALQVSSDYLLSGGESGLYMTQEQSQEIGRKTRDAYVAEMGSDSDEPTALLTSEESQALAEQIRSTADAVETVGAELDEKAAQAAEGEASTVGTDDQAKRIELLEENLTISRQLCLNELTLLTRGLTALAKEIGPIAYERTLAAMERPV